MVRVVPNFPQPGMEFHDVLAIAPHPEGLQLCTSLLQAHFSGDWARVGAIACCETVSFVSASPLAMAVNTPLVLIREADKVPPSVVSAAKSPSNVSSTKFGDTGEKMMEMASDVTPKNASAVVVNDVLASGNTIRAVLQLLAAAGIKAEDVTVLVVAELPVHRGRQALRQNGFGKTRIQGLLTFGGA